MFIKVLKLLSTCFQVFFYKGTLSEILNTYKYFHDDVLAYFCTSGYTEGI